MINELYRLSQALEHRGLLSSATHPDVGNVGKCQCLLIDINRKGNPEYLRLLKIEETASLWKHNKGTLNSFPAIRIQEPLLCADESRKVASVNWKKLKFLDKQALLQTLSYSNINPKSRNILMSDWSRRKFELVLTDNHSSLEALRRLINRFPDKSQQDLFYADLVSLIHAQIDQPESEAMLDFCASLLVGSWNNKTGKYVSGCMTYYDIYETIDVQCKVISRETSEALIKLLNSSEAETVSGEIQQNVCPLLGRCEPLKKDRYPNPNLPQLGITYLYSRKNTIPCLSRYGMSGATAFSASKSSIEAISNAISFLTAPSRKNKTWSAISDSNQDKPNLLLAYLDDCPENDALLAELLSGSRDSDDIGYTFEELCRQVIDGIEPVLDKNPNSIVNLIILELLDPGRKQILFSNFFSAKQMEQNVLEWVEASKNHPEIIMRFYEKKELREKHPICVGPSEICRLLKINYSAFRKSKPQKSSDISMQNIYQLYMPQSQREKNDTVFLKDILRKTMLRTGNMLADFKQQMTLTYTLLSVNWPDVKNACMSVSLISILLWRLDVRKENYMIEVPFNIGQFLQLADMLHKEYYIQVRNQGDRKKTLPTHLIGNEMLSVAAEKPNEAINRLRERMRIYLAWANTATGDDAGLAKWILARHGEVCSKISARDIPEVFDTAEQAQVLLGYLATIPYEKKEEKKS